MFVSKSVLVSRPVIIEHVPRNLTDLADSANKVNEKEFVTSWEATGARTTDKTFANIFRPYLHI